LRPTAWRRGSTVGPRSSPRSTRCRGISRSRPSASTTTRRRSRVPTRGARSSSADLPQRDHPPRPARLGARAGDAPLRLRRAGRSGQPTSAALEVVVSAAARAGRAARHVRHALRRRPLPCSLRCTGGSKPRCSRGQLYEPARVTARAIATASEGELIALGRAHRSAGPRAVDTDRITGRDAAPRGLARAAWAVPSAERSCRSSSGSTTTGRSRRRAGGSARRGVRRHDAPRASSPPRRIVGGRARLRRRSRTCRRRRGGAIARRPADGPRRPARAAEYDPEAGD
jgi:hypothetical protein